jgi:peptide chain release factor 2
MIEDLSKEIMALTEEIELLGKLLGVKEKRKQVDGLQLKMSEQNFWDDQKAATGIVGELKNIKSDVDDWDDLRQKLDDLRDLLSLGDVSLEPEIIKEAESLRKECDKMRLRILFSQKFDGANAIVEINSGAGGTEACDWAGMLFRMYFRWAEDKKCRLKVLNEVRGEETGIKNITFLIEGTRVYGFLKSERGVHRLVRISPFDSNKRRHTSFASVDVIPEIKEDIEIDIKPEELRIDTFRSSGAGGQHVNVTDSAVRITHLSTGIVVSCQNERSQHQNRIQAMNVLKAKLYARKEEENKKELDGMAGKKQRIEWGSQIRSYVLHPYLLVKDHRTDFQDHDAWGVLDGKIDDFCYAYLKQEASA